MMNYTQSSKTEPGLGAEAILLPIKENEFVQKIIYIRVKKVRAAYCVQHNNEKDPTAN